VIDQVSELENQYELLMTVLSVVAGLLGGGYVAGRALRIHFVIPIFVIGSATLAYLAYRERQSQIEYCKDFPVPTGGDKFSCLDAGNWFAYNLAMSFLLLVELGLTVMLATGLVRWWKGRRLKRLTSHHVVARAP
jgi:hypothetical protein